MSASASSIGRPSWRLGQHARELLARGRLALVDDGLEALLEAVPRLQRGGEREQDVRQLVLERLQPPSGLRTRRYRTALPPRGANAPSTNSGLSPATVVTIATRNDAADDDVEELDRAQRHVGALQHPVHVRPPLEVAERPLGHAHEARAHGEPVALLGDLASAHGRRDVRREARLEPGPAARGRDEHQRQEHEHADDEPEPELAPLGVVAAAGSRREGFGAVGVSPSAPARPGSCSRGRHFPTTSRAGRVSPAAPR